MIQSSKKKSKSIVERVKAPTPSFFRYLRNFGLVLAGSSAAILACPVALPALLVTIATYSSVAGTVIAAISQTTVETE